MYQRFRECEVNTWPGSGNGRKSYLMYYVTAVLVLSAAAQCHYPFWQSKTDTTWTFCAPRLVLRT